MIRVVLDANVYISAFVFGGVPRLAPEEVVSDCLCFVSQPIQEEVERVLQDKFSWSQVAAAARFAEISQLAQWVEPAESLAGIVSDDDDHRILECALEARADVIVTGDKGLLGLRSFRGIAIVSAREFLDRVRAG